MRLPREILSDTAVTAFGNAGITAFGNPWAILKRNTAVIAKWGRCERVEAKHLDYSPSKTASVSAFSASGVAAAAIRLSAVMSRSDVFCAAMASASVPASKAFM